MPISEITRRAIIDELSLSKIHWSGRLEEPAFLARLYKLEELPSTEGRFKDAAGDVWQHRVNNYDWDDDWVFYDSRFDLMDDDEEFLRFLAETVHPVVRPNEAELRQLVALYNEHLRPDGWEIREVSQISGRPVFAAHNRLTVPPALGQVEKSVKPGDMAYLSQQITRIESSVETDPALAIGTAKELVETCCATILRELGVVPDNEWTLSKLVKETASRLRLTPEDISDGARGAASIRQVLGNLGGMVAGIAELRNYYGTGHGKAIGHGGLGPRHARLAVGAASTLAAFLFSSLPRTARLGVEQEGVVPAVPRDVHEPDKHTCPVAGSDPARTVLLNPVPPAGHWPLTPPWDCTSSTISSSVISSRQN